MTNLSSRVILPINNAQMRCYSSATFIKKVVIHKKILNYKLKG